MMLRYLLFILPFCFCHPVYSQNVNFWINKQNEADNLFAHGKYRDALTVYEQVAEETASQYSQFWVAWIYEHGLGIERNCKEAARWYTLSANSKNQAAQNNLYVLYRNGCPELAPNDNLAIHYLSMSADSGNARAQANLSLLYATGELVKENQYLAYDLAQRSAQQNDIYGTLLLAGFFREGVGVPIDLKKYFDLLTNAVSINIDESDGATKQQAQYLLAHCFLDGIGTPQSTESAYKWFLIAQSGPDQSIFREAQKSIEKLEDRLPDTEKQKMSQLASSIVGKSTLANPSDILLALQQAIKGDREQEAIRLAMTLSSQENAEGQVFLGLMYRDGYGTIRQDLDEAYILFKRSCKSKDWSGCAFQVDVLTRMNRSDDAITLLNEVKSTAPPDDDTRLFLAELYLGLGKVDMAEEITRSILLGDPLNKDAKSLLSVITQREKKITKD